MAIRGSGVRYNFNSALYATLFKAHNFGADVRVKGKKLSDAIDPEDLAKVEAMELPNPSSGSWDSEDKQSYSVTFAPTISQPNLPPVTKKCPQCKAILRYKVKFCNKCGFKFQNVAEDVEEL